jgi:hypothetical protein
VFGESRERNRGVWKSYAQGEVAESVSGGDGAEGGEPDGFAEARSNVMFAASVPAADFKAHHRFRQSEHLWHWPGADRLVSSRSTFGRHPSARNRQQAEAARHQQRNR